MQIHTLISHHFITEAFYPQAYRVLTMFRNTFLESRFFSGTDKMKLSCSFFFSSSSFKKTKNKSIPGLCRTPPSTFFLCSSTLHGKQLLRNVSARKWCKASGSSSQKDGSKPADAPVFQPTVETLCRQMWRRIQQKKIICIITYTCPSLTTVILWWAHLSSLEAASFAMVKV